MAAKPQQNREFVEGVAQNPAQWARPDDPELAEILAAWPNLPGETRGAVLAVVRAAVVRR